MRKEWNRDRAREWEMCERDGSEKNGILFAFIVSNTVCLFFLFTCEYFTFSQLDSGSKQLTLSFRLSSILTFSLPHSRWVCEWIDEWMNLFRKISSTKRTNQSVSHTDTTNDRKLQLHNRKTFTFWYTKTAKTNAF